ncbi:MAG: hypothetical protein FWG98_02825 [Candidatus Cloacimonetes bacterium]|nr:hypothetical protein [Candidatus Cloacimonadota bacterium]
MINKIKLIGIFILVLLFAITIVACGNKNPEPAQNAVSAASPEASGTYDVEAMINEYEEIMDEYISTMLRIMAGDMDAMALIESIDTRVTNWQLRMSNVPEEDFTIEHLQRLDEIGKKMEEALSID